MIHKTIVISSLMLDIYETSVNSASICSWNNHPSKTRPTLVAYITLSNEIIQMPVLRLCIVYSMSIHRVWYSGNINSIFHHCSWHSVSPCEVKLVTFRICLFWVFHSPEEDSASSVGCNAPDYSHYASLLWFWLKQSSLPFYGVHECGLSCTHSKTINNVQSTFRFSLNRKFVYSLVIRKFWEHNVFLPINIIIP